MGDLTENFDRTEFACNCGCGLNSIHLGLVHRLQVVRDIVKEPILVNSGCRCLKRNASVGSDIGSYHLSKNGCAAADFEFENDPGYAMLKRVAENLIFNWSGGFCLEKMVDSQGKTIMWIHVDVGPRRRW